MQGGGCDQGFHEICQISHEIHMKSTRFHEIYWISKLWAFAWWSSIGLSFFKRPIRRVFAETSDFIRFGVDLTCEIQWISPRYHLWNPPKIIKASVSAKTLQFDECRVGDFTLKSSGFHPWNLADFTQISPVKSTQNYKSKCFSKNSSVWWMQGGGFHPRNSVDFTLKSGGFEPWNLVDFTQISPVKSTQNYKSKCFSKNSSVWWMQGGGFHPWNPPDFTCEIHPKL